MLTATVPVSSLHVPRISPKTEKFVARVTTKEGRLVLTMIMPFTNPMSVPNAKPAKIPIHVGKE
jgi:hypothetical protein